MKISRCLRSHATADCEISTLDIDLRFKPNQIESSRIRRSSTDISRCAGKTEESLQMGFNDNMELWLRISLRSHRQRLVLWNRSQPLFRPGSTRHMRWNWSGLMRIPWNFELGESQW